ncbi:hypothetical protein P7C73_g6051, partial [Tremellales sp. Uapishka_1]
MSRSPESSARRMSISSSHSRPEAEEPVPVKRMRVDTRAEDRTRGKRLFGNLLGTLQKAKNEDKSSRTSEAAKRREQLSSRIAEKLRSETTLHHQIIEYERELKQLRIATDSSDYVLGQKEVAMKARHEHLAPISKFLHTKANPPAPLIFEHTLLAVPPIPLASGPSRTAPTSATLKPLYFLPKILSPHQETMLSVQLTEVDQLIQTERETLAAEKATVKETAIQNKAKIEDLTDKLSDLRRKVEPAKPKAVDRDDFGRIPRKEEDDKEKGEEKEDEMQLDAPAEKVRDPEEEGVLIKGEDGDVEVEY